MFSTSGKFKLDGVDWLKLGRTLLIATVAAAVPVLTEAVSAADFGVLDSMITGALVVLLDAGRRWARDNQKAVVGA